MIFARNLPQYTNIWLEDKNNKHRNRPDTPRCIPIVLIHELLPLGIEKFLVHTTMTAIPFILSTVRSISSFKLKK